LQIEKIKILNEEEIKQIEKIIEKNYGAKIVLSKFSVLKTAEEKIWIASKDCLKFLSDKLKINLIGLNFGKLKRNDKINLTIEGSQIVGKDVVKNVVYLSEITAEKFLKGSDVKPEKEIDCEYHNFVIVKFNEEILGSSLLTEEKLKNLLPKSRRIF